MVHSGFPGGSGVSVATIGFIGAAVYGIMKKRGFGFWLAWIVCGLAVTLLPVKIAWIVAERYAYMAYIGLCVLAAMLFDTLLSIKRLYVVGICLMIGVVCALCTRTIIRNNDWRTEDSLWVATAIVSPEIEYSWNNMGDVYARHGQYDQSIAAFTRATAINPNYADAYHNIGNTYVQIKKYTEAIPFFEKALSINPNLWQSYQDLGYIAVAQGDIPKAIGYLDKAIMIDPTNMDVRHMREKLQNQKR
jgi:tetratricopeptide (TPR) repeat protein